MVRLCARSAFPSLPDRLSRLQSFSALVSPLCPRPHFSSPGFARLRPVSRARHANRDIAIPPLLPYPSQPSPNDSDREFRPSPPLLVSYSHPNLHPRTHAVLLQPLIVSLVLDVRASCFWLADNSPPLSCYPSCVLPSTRSNLSTSILPSAAQLKPPTPEFDELAVFILSNSAVYYSSRLSCMHCSITH